VLRLARGEFPLRGPIDGSETPGGARPDDLAEITYLDHFGNAMTGMHMCNLPGMPVLRLMGTSWSARALFPRCRKTPLSGMTTPTGWLRPTLMADAPRRSSIS